MDSGFSMRTVGSPETPPLRRPVRTDTAPPRRRFRFPRKGERKRFVLRLLGGFILLGIAYIAFLWATLPNIDDPRSLFAAQSTVITDRNGIELYRLFTEEDRTYVEGENIAPGVKKAIVAIEDERFYDRGCLDVRAIARAFFRLGQAGGGSTLTRQLARNALNLKDENIVNRKVKELVLGCQLESRFSKDELLDLYLNWIPFGQNAYGIEQASRVYFAASSSGLTLAQSAVLAALPQRPTYFSPYGRHLHTTVSESVTEQVMRGEITLSSQIPDEDIIIGLLGASVGTGSNALYVGGRTDQVLRKMQDADFITEQERLTALEELEDITFEKTREDIRAPHFVLWVREQAEQIIGITEKGMLERGGLQIQTTLDWKLQEIAQNTVASHSGDVLTRFGAHNIALLAMDPKTRHVLAYVGNTDYADEEHGGKIDMVRVPRQPGSSFKPIVYSAAFQQGYGPATVLYDVPTKIGDDEPRNYDGTFMGLITIRKALAASRNIPAVKAFFLAGGEEPILALADAMGAPTPLLKKKELAEGREDGFDYGWPLALGAAETPLLEMVQAYATIADGGLTRPVVSIEKITDRNGNILYAAEESPQERSVLDPRIAYQITSILSDVSARPTEYWQQQLSVAGTEAAAKTGTSNKCLEWEDENTCKLRKPDNAWTLGFTPQLVAGVWAGNADSSSMFEKGDGLNTASALWKEFMEKAHRTFAQRVTTFPVPPGLVQPQISLLSGELPTPCTPVAYRAADVFLEERAPTLSDPACADLMIDRVTNLLASPDCPSEARQSGSFLVARSILPDRWPAWEDGVQKWVTAEMQRWNASPDHSGSLLPLPVAPTGTCDPSLTPGRLTKPTLTIEFPEDGGRASYPSFQPKLTLRTGSSVRELRFTIDGKRVAVRTEEPFDGPLRVPRSIEEEGRHTLEVTLTDEYYNTATAQAEFTFSEDEDGPQVSWVTPQDGSTVQRGEEITMRADADDPEGGLKFVQFFLDDLLLTTKPNAPYELTYGFTVSPGEYRLRAVATDFAGNTAEDEVEITVTD